MAFVDLRKKTTLRFVLGTLAFLSVFVILTVTLLLYKTMAWFVLPLFFIFMFCLLELEFIIQEIEENRNV